MSILDIFRNRSNKGDKENIAVLVAELEQLGYYRYATGDTGKIKKDSISAGYPYGWEDSGRDFSADAEELAEGGGGELIISVTPFLSHENITITSISDHIDDKGYILSLNDKEYSIYTAQELKKNNLWEIASWRVMAVINKLLAEAGSQERCCYIYGGNDMRVIFIDDLIYKHLVNCGSLPESEKPKCIPDGFLL